MKTFNYFIKESIIDPVQQEWSPQIFEIGRAGKVRLREIVIDFIVNHLISNLKSKVEVVDYVMLGSTLTHRYTETSDVDINVLIKCSDEKLEEYRKILKDYNGFLIPGTQHPVNFFIINSRDEYEHNNDLADGIFDIKKNEFVKTPDESQKFNVKNYMIAYKTRVEKIKGLKAELKDELISYKELMNTAPAHRKLLQAELNNVIKELDASANEIVDLYEKIKNDRRIAFANPLTPKEIRDYGSKNRLPENVVYKLLEKHYYLDFLHKVERAIGDDLKVQPEEIGDLEKADE